MEDLVRTRDGRRIGLLSHSTLKDRPDIKEAQIIQRGYEDFKFISVPVSYGSFDRADYEAHILREMSNRVGGDLRVEFQYVDELPRTAAGKVRPVIVNLPAEVEE